MAHFSGCPSRWGLVACLAGVTACGAPDDLELSVVRIAPEAAPDCGAPADARTMILRALGEFPASEATAQSVQLGEGEGERFRIERFPAGTQVLEAEVRGFGGALRAIGRSAVFSLEALSSDAEIPIFMAPREGVCATGPALTARDNPALVPAGEGVLVIGGTSLEGEPSLAIEIYRPALGRFDLLSATTYGDTSALGLAGASVTALASGDVAIIGGAATAYQIFDHESEEFLAPAFYREARGRHAALALPDGQVFVAAGCSQVSDRSCVDGSLLRTTSILNLGTGEITQGPSLQIERIGGRAWLEAPGQVLLVGGEDGDGVAVDVAERVFLDGTASQTIAGVSGASARSAAGTIWAGLAKGATATQQLSAIAPSRTIATTGLEAAFADSGVVMTSLDDGSVFAVGEAGAQRIRSLEGESFALEIPELVGRVGHAACKLADGTVLISGGHSGAGEAAPALIFRPSLLGPESASSTSSFSAAELSEGLSAQDPGQVAIRLDGGAHLELRSDGLAEALLLAGPRPQTATVLAAAGVSENATLLFYFAWRSATEYHEIEIGPGTAPVMRRVRGDQVAQIGIDTAGTCQATVVAGSAIAISEGVHEMELRVERTDVVLRIGGEAVLTCALEDAPGPGMLGIGVVGDAAATLRLDLISLSR